MKNSIWFFLALFLLQIFGCEEENISVPNFEVSALDDAHYANKDITFQITGSPDFINFYSGENGKRYEYAGRISAEGVPQLQFTTVRANGKQDGSLKLLVSSDFPGITVGSDSLTRIKIASSSWTDITNRALLSTGASTKSGIVDLTDFAQQEKPVYIAFKYLATEGSIQNKWTISALTLANVLPDGTVYTIANTTSAAIANYGVSTVFSPGWKFYRFINTYNWTLSSNNLIITGATNTSGTAAEAWAIMGPVDLSTVAPDVGVTLKGMDTRLSTHIYKYTAAGTYTATFVGATNNIYGKKEITKQIEITVNP